MRLRDLDPHFMRSVDDRTSQIVETIDQAHGLRFECPVCGEHGIICWSRTAGTPDDRDPGPGRWRLVGTSLDDLSLMEEPGASRSVLLTGGCKAHFFVTNGEIQVCC